MRLTLRTLLAYLDDTLEPAQAKLIGQKVAESDAAQELMNKIKQVTRRRRLTTPPASSNLNPNTIAEYLDNEVSAEQAAEVEQICLSSDVHLAEVAACHQILTLVLGEPLAAPPSSQQRMYGLVKGPEAIPFRKPAQAAPAKAPAPAPAVEHREIDDTLRMGMPAVTGKSPLGNKLLLFGGGFLAACLLIFALIQVLNLGGDANNDNKKEIVKVDPNKKDKDDPEKKEPDDKKDPDKKEPDGKDPVKKDTDPKKEDMKDPGKEPPMLPEVPFAPPDPRAKAVGQFVLGEFKEPAWLYQQSADKNDWKRLGARAAEVFSNRPLLSLPASRTSVQVGKGVHLTLWGNMPELVGAPIYESLVELHAHDVLDADLTLRRGRIVLTSTRGDRPAMVRVRFDNPTPSDTPDYFDIHLDGKDSAVVVDRIGSFPPNEPFYLNPKNPNRLGPAITLGVVVIKGHASMKSGDVTYGLAAPPGNALLVWNNRTGLGSPRHLQELPTMVLADAPLPEKADPKFRKDMNNARTQLDKDLFKQALLTVALKENAEGSQDPSRRRLAVRGLAALDDLDTLLDIVEPTKYADQRFYILQTLREWIALDRDNDYKLFDKLKDRFKGFQAGAIMKLLHELTEQERGRPETYDLLIDNLVNPNLLIRELSAMHLYQLAPIGRDIPYRADGDSTIRERAHTLWRQRIPPGQLPPTGLPMPKKM